MSKLTPAWVDAQIEHELERGCCASAVRDLAALVTVKGYLSPGIGVPNKEALALVLAAAGGAGMRDYNEVNVGEYTDRREMHMHPKHGHGEDGVRESVGAYPRGEHHLTKEIAEEWVQGMQNADPEHPTGAKWPMEAVKPLAIKHGFTDPDKQLEFWAVINMMYSDYCETAKKHGVSTLDFYADMAKAWMRDKDGADHKTAAYIECCTK